MIDATILLKGSTVFSPWFARQADLLRVTAECVAVNGATLTVKLYTKDGETPGDGAAVDAAVSIALSSVSRSTAEWKTAASQPGVLQLLRFQYTVTGSTNNDWILFRLLPPVWFDAVALP